MDFPKPFPKPIVNMINIYSKKESNICSKIQSLLEKENINYNIINCDEFLVDRKNEFIKFIKQLSNQEFNSIPMVFAGRLFIGGYNEVKTYIEIQEVFKQLDKFYK
jgi:glutaredoxin